MKKLGLILGLCLGLAACDSTTTQTTSGEAYLSRHPQTAAEIKEGSFEDQLRRAASVEPTLTFPARIGLARIDGGHLSAVPGDEAEAWQAVRDHLGPEFGEFVPVSPLVAKLAVQGVGHQDNSRMETINEIRLGAARQHLDAVLIYEAYSKTSTHSNILSIADITIIGGYVMPSKVKEAQGYATALLIDVMQGYPYGTVEVQTDKNTELGSRWGWGSKEDGYGGKTFDAEQSKAVFALTPKVEDMIRTVKAGLAMKQTVKP